MDWRAARRAGLLPAKPTSVSIQERQQDRLHFLRKYRQDIVVSIPVLVQERSITDLYDLTFHSVNLATSTFGLDNEPSES
jgi:uncharacterized sporulation protein YeaH/YhbH (DUF444 family)